MRTTFIKRVEQQACVWLAALAAVTLLHSPSAGAQDVFPLQAMNAKIAALVSPNAQPGEVQVATLPGVVEWNDKGGKFQFFTLCDTLPAWAPEIKDSGLSISRRYYSFLTGIKAAKGDLMADQLQRELALKAAATGVEYDTERLKLLQRWTQQVAAEASVPPAQRTAYATWMKRNSANLSALYISHVSALSLWLPEAQKAAPTTVGHSLNELIGDAHRVKVTTYSGAETNVLECSPGIDLGEELVAARKATEGKSPDIILEARRRTGERNESWSSWGGSAGWGPFAVSASGTRHEVHTTENNFRLYFEVPRVLRFKVVRPWLSLDVINAHKAPTILPGTELADLQPLWGAKGSFPLVPLEFVVAYRPRVTLTMSSTDYSTVKQNVQGGGSFSIGPFSVGGGGGNGSVVDKWDDSGSTVVVGTGADAFVLLAVVNRVLP